MSIDCPPVGGLHSVVSVRGEMGEPSAHDQLEEHQEESVGEAHPREEDVARGYEGPVVGKDEDHVEEPSGGPQGGGDGSVQKSGGGVEVHRGPDDDRGAMSAHYAEALWGDGGSRDEEPGRRGEGWR